MRLERQGWQGQIIGPHGSGKSTLLAALLPTLNQRRPLFAATLHDGKDRLPFDIGSLHETSLLVVDGYEQLSWWQRRRLRVRCRPRRHGLLVTTHRDLGLPTLYRTQVTPELAQSLIEGLLGKVQRASFSMYDIEAHLARHHGNLREFLFDLYDRYEAGLSYNVR